MLNGPKGLWGPEDFLLMHTEPGVINLGTGQAVCSAFTQDAASIV